MKAKYHILSILFVVLIGFVSCNDDDDDNGNDNDNIVNFTADIDGGNEVPANNSTATGVGNFLFNKTTKILTGTVTYTGINPTGAHIHKGAAGENGGVVFPLGTAPFSSPISYTSMALTESQETDLMNGMYYINLHTTAFPDGEIRGQLMQAEN